MTHIFLSMQAGIEKAEAKKYGAWSVEQIERKSANIHGIGFPFSGDALRLVRDET